MPGACRIPGRFHPSERHRYWMQRFGKEEKSCFNTEPHEATIA